MPDEQRGGGPRGKVPQDPPARRVRPGKKRQESFLLLAGGESRGRRGASGKGRGGRLECRWWLVVVPEGKFSEASLMLVACVREGAESALEPSGGATATSSNCVSYLIIQLGGRNLRHGPVFGTFAQAS